MNIVVLDGHTLNPGDLAWDDLAALGDLSVHERTPHEQVIERATGAEIALTNKTVLDRGLLARLPKLRYVGLLSTGTNVVDLEAARKLGIAVTNVPAYSTQEVAQTTMSLLLELFLHTGYYTAAVAGGRWSASRDFSFIDPGHRPRSLHGKTLGLVGLGSIGRAVAGLALAFGMRVVANVRTRRELPGVELVGLDDLLSRSDAISLHCPLTTDTRHLIDGAALRRVQPHALLVNTARGDLVDSAALALALNEDRLAGAGLDVLDAEPPPEDHPLLHAKNCIITPHIAWAAREARERLMREIAENLRAFLAGRERNRVV